MSNITADELAAIVAIRKGGDISRCNYDNETAIRLPYSDWDRIIAALRLQKRFDALESEMDGRKAGPCYCCREHGCGDGCRCNEEAANG